MTWTATIYVVDDAARAERFGIQPRVIGGAPRVWQRLRRGLPGLFARGWEGWVTGEGWRMQLSTWRHLSPTSRGAVDSIQVDVLGPGDPLPALVALCRENEWQLFDDQSGCFVDLDDLEGSSWPGTPAPAPPSRSWAMLLVPDALRRELARREVVLVDLDGAPGPALDETTPRFPLGHADDVRARLDAALPTLRWVGRRGRWRRGPDRLDVQLRVEGLVDTLRISVAGPGADALLETICEPNGWSVWEPGHWSYLHASSSPAPALPHNVLPLRRR